MDPQWRSRRTYCSCSSLHMTGSSPSFACYLWILTSGLLWGITDPLLKLFGKGGQAEESPFLSLLKSNWRYAAAFCANQLGSVAFAASLAHCPLSAAAPVANVIKFATSAATGVALLHERLPGPREAVGLALVFAGTVVQLLSTR